MVDAGKYQRRKLASSGLPSRPTIAVSLWAFQWQRNQAIQLVLPMDQTEPTHLSDLRRLVQIQRLAMAHRESRTGHSSRFCLITADTFVLGVVIVFYAHRNAAISSWKSPIRLTASASIDTGHSHSNGAVLTASVLLPEPTVMSAAPLLTACMTPSVMRANHCLFHQLFVTAFRQSNRFPFQRVFLRIGYPHVDPRRDPQARPHPCQHETWEQADSGSS